MCPNLIYVNLGNIVLISIEFKFYFGIKKNLVNDYKTPKEIVFFKKKFE